LSLTYDRTPPTVVLSTTVGSSFNSSTFTVNLDISEPLASYADLFKNVVISNGVQNGFIGNGTNYTFTVTPSGQGEVRVNVAAGVCTDVAGNPNTAAVTLSRTFDSVEPAVLSVTTTSGNLFKDAPMPVSITFGEPVFNFVASDVTANGVISNFTGSGTNYSFNVYPSAQGAVTVAIGANVCADAAGNGNTASTVPALSSVYDSVPPASVVLINAPTGLVNSGTAVIEVSPTNDVVSYIYRKGHGDPVVWDAAGWSDRIPVASNTVFTGLTAGEVRVEVFGYDLAGNETINPAVASWIVNITPPEWLAAGPIGDGTFTLNWEQPVNGDAYRIEVASNTNFIGSVAYTNSSISNLTLQVTGVAVGSTNYCRIQTLLGASSSSFGETLAVVASANTPYPVNRIASEMTVTVGGSDVWNLTNLFAGSGLTFTATSATPAVVSVQLAGAQLTFNYLTVGSSEVVVSARNSAGAVSEVAILFHVTPSAQIGDASGAISFVSNLNVYAQTVSVTNNTGFTVQAVKLTINGILPANTTLREATSQAGTNAVLIWNGELAPGASVDFDLTYFNPARTPVTVGSITVEFSLMQVLPNVDLEAPISGLALHRDLNGVGVDSFLLEFPTVQGATYYVFYRDSLATGEWIRVQKPVIAHGVWYMWFDPGPPVTAPRGATRFYKVQKQQ
jgi:hypothetical protein